MATKNPDRSNPQPDAESAPVLHVPETHIEMDFSKATRHLLPLPPLGSPCVVRVAEGVKLINNEVGQFFAEGVDTPVTSTVTLHRRLADGDLTLVG